MLHQRIGQEDPQMEIQVEVNSFHLRQISEIKSRLLNADESNYTTYLLDVDKQVFPGHLARVFVVMGFSSVSISHVELFFGFLLWKPSVS